MKKPWVLSYPLSAQRRLWSDWADAQADLSLRWAHTHFAGFVVSRLIYSYDSGVVWGGDKLSDSKIDYFSLLKLNSIEPPHILFLLSLKGFIINSLRAPKKFLHGLKRNVLTLYSNERVCQITQQNILCFLIHSFVVMETVDEVWKSNIWMRISVA